jgi:hypothetical protein
MKLQADLDAEDSPIMSVMMNVVGGGQPPLVSNDSSLTLPTTCCEQQSGPGLRSTLR